MPPSSSGRSRPEPSNIVDAKVRLPSPPPGSVSRTALVNRLRATPASVVTLVAPAGYGKTTLLAQWAERDRRPFAWLSLDERDDDPAVLLSQLAAALDRVGAQGSEAVDLPVLTSRLASAGALVLVLDDAHLLRSRGSREAITALAEHVPPGSTLAVAARTPPGLPIARLRADGGLLEVPIDELALTPREAEALLRGLEAELPGEDAAELLARCEGWPAGIRLSVLAWKELEGSAPRPAVPGGDDRFLAEYFRSEFLGPLKPELLTFLRRTSILERLDRSVVRRRAGEQGLRAGARQARAASARRSTRSPRQGIPLPPAVRGPAQAGAGGERARADRRAPPACSRLVRGARGSGGGAPPRRRLR